jgi:hypothetical protein
LERDIGGKPSIAAGSAIEANISRRELGSQKRRELGIRESSLKLRRKRLPGSHRLESAARSKNSKGYNHGYRTQLLRRVTKPLADASFYDAHGR